MSAPSGTGSEFPLYTDGDETAALRWEQDSIRDALKASDFFAEQASKDLKAALVRIEDLEQSLSDLVGYLKLRADSNGLTSLVVTESVFTKAIAALAKARGEQS